MIHRRGAERAEGKFQKQKLCELCVFVVKFFSPSLVAALPHCVFRGETEPLRKLRQLSTMVMQFCEAADWDVWSS
jgi:hypothetical protein